MSDFINIKKIINDQLIALLNVIKNTTCSDKQEFNVNINIQIYVIKKIDDKKSEKKFYSVTLNDNQYKYNGFIIMDNEQSNKLKSGQIINLKKIIPKKVKSGLFIMIKDFSLLNENINNLPEVKLIKENDGHFIDENGLKILGGKEEIKLEKANINEINKTNSKKDGLEPYIEIRNNELVYTSLKELTTFSRDFIIFVRIIKKSEIKTFETRNSNNTNILTGQGKLFYFIVLDKDGNEMQCTCFNKSVDKFYDIIEEDQLYEIKGGYVKINDKKYTRIKSDYKIVLDENSTITKKFDDNSIIKRNNLNIVKIKDLQNLKIYTIVDICAVVLEVGEVVVKNTRNGNQPLKKIILGDSSKFKVELSLWRIHSKTNIKLGDILLINNVKVGEYKGRNLSTFEETSIKINPSTNTNQFIKEIEDFVISNEMKIELFSDFEYLYEHKLQKYQEIEEPVFKSVHIRDVLEYLDDIDEPKYPSKIRATVTQIIHNEKNFYMGCIDKNCKRKLSYDSDTKEYWCPGCSRKTKIPTYYYTLSLRVKDASCEYWIEIFGKTAESIMHCTAEEYKNYVKGKDQQKLKEISDSIEFRIFNFWVKPKLQIYNTISKKKLYTYKIEPLEQKTEAHRLVAYLEKELKSKK